MSPKLSIIFIKNLLHLSITLSPFLIASIVVAVQYYEYEKWIIVIPLIVTGGIFLLMLPLIVTNCKIVFDLISKKKTKTIVKIDSVMPAYRLSTMGLRRAYVFDIFSSNYTAVFNLYCTAEDGSDIKNTFY